VQAHQLRSQATDGRCGAVFARQLDRTVQVLEQRAHVPSDRFELALGHLRCKDLQRLGVGETTGQGVGQQAGVHP